MKSTAKILVLAILGSTLSIFLTSCTASSSNKSFSGGSGTTTSQLARSHRSGY